MIGRRAKTNTDALNNLSLRGNGSDRSPAIGGASSSARNDTYCVCIRTFRFQIVILASLFWLLSFSSARAQENSGKQAEDYARQSQAYYQRAVSEYERLISEGEDLDRLCFELGRLYYDHGQFQQAEEALQKTNSPPAVKLLAVSYYRLNNFTKALEIFSRTDSGDDEYLYYYGLTCERLNLFDKALEIYRRINAAPFIDLASSQINLIEKQASSVFIKDIAPDINKIIQDAPSGAKYPQAGALILSCDEEIRITPENTQVSSLHYLVKILNERGKQDFSETHIEYDSTYERIELEYARAIRPDGMVAEVGTRHIRDVSKYLNFPLYSNARVYIISFPEVSDGSYIEYKVKICRNQLINKKDFIISYPVQAAQPVIAANFTVSLPKGKAVFIKRLNEKYNTFGANLKPEMKEKDGFLIYNWQFKDIPQIIPESNMPPFVEITPVFFISSFKSWQEIYNWWWGLAKDKIKADPAIQAKVKELTGGLNSQEEKIRAIYNFAARHIRYVAVEYGQAGYQPHNAADIFKNKYGDCKDQAVLLVTMLREAGIPAWPALIPTKEYYNLDKDFPSMLFNHCIAAVPVRDKIVFLDPTAETCSFGDLPSGDQNRGVLIFKEDKYEIGIIPLYPAGHNLVRQRLDIKLDDEEAITAKKSVLSFGIYDQAQRYWLLYTAPKLIAETLKEKIQEVSIGGTLSEYDIKNLDNLNEPVALSYGFFGPEYFTAAGSLRIMPQLAAVDTALVAKEKRIYPLDFAVLDSKETLFSIEIPKDFTVKYIPQSVNEESPWLKFSAEYLYQGNTLLFRQDAQLKKNIVQEKDYPVFKAFFERLAKKIKQRVILERLKGAE